MGPHPDSTAERARHAVDYITGSVRQHWPLIVAGLLGGAALGAFVRAIVLLAKTSREAWPPAVGLGALVGVIAALTWVFARSTVGRVRVSEATLKVGFADMKIALDPDSRQQLWRFFIEMTSRIATRELAASEGLLEEAVSSLYTLFDRARTDLSARAPRYAAPAGTVPPQVYVLNILNEDLRPCLARWHVRIDAWKRTGLPESEWPLVLRQACRADLESTRRRIVERAWQLGEGLGIPDLQQLLPPRPPAGAAIAAEQQLAAAETAAGEPRDADSLKAAWHIWVEAATRIATQELPADVGLIGEAIASVYALTGEIRTELKAMAPGRSREDPESFEGLALTLFNGNLRPFLAEWHPRYEAFKALGRPEAEWDEASACRTALAATRQACLPIIRAMGRKLRAPPLP